MADDDQMNIRLVLNVDNLKTLNLNGHGFEHRLEKLEILNWKIGYYSLAVTLSRAHMT